MLEHGTEAGQSINIGDKIGQADWRHNAGESP
jgi:hypothetical protein